MHLHSRLVLGALLFAAVACERKATTRTSRVESRPADARSSAPSSLDSGSHALGGARVNEGTPPDQNSTAAAGDTTSKDSPRPLPGDSNESEPQEPIESIIFRQVHDQDGMLDEASKIAIHDYVHRANETSATTSQLRPISERATALLRFTSRLPEDQETGHRFGLIVREIGTLLAEAQQAELDSLTTQIAELRAKSNDLSRAIERVSAISSPEGARAEKAARDRRDLCLDAIEALGESAARLDVAARMLKKRLASLQGFDFNNDFERAVFIEAIEETLGLD